MGCAQCGVCVPGYSLVDHACKLCPLQQQSSHMSDGQMVGYWLVVIVLSMLVLVFLYLLPLLAPLEARRTPRSAGVRRAANPTGRKKASKGFSIPRLP